MARNMGVKMRVDNVFAIHGMAGKAVGFRDSRSIPLSVDPGGLGHPVSPREDRTELADTGKILAYTDSNENELVIQLGPMAALCYGPL